MSKTETNNVFVELGGSSEGALLFDQELETLCPRDTTSVSGAVWPLSPFSAVRWTKLTQPIVLWCVLSYTLSFTRAGGGPQLPTSQLPSQASTCSDSQEKGGRQHR